MIKVISVDPRLRGKGRAELTIILADAFSEIKDIKTVADNAGFDMKLFPDTQGVSSWNAWTSLIRLFDDSTEPNLDGLLSVAYDILLARNSIYSGQLKSWLDRGKRQEHLQAAINDLFVVSGIIERTAEVRDLQDTLDAVRSSCFDIVEFLEDGEADEILNSGLLGNQTNIEREELVSAIVVLRLSAERLKSNISKLRGSPQLGFQTREQKFVQEDVIDGVLMSNRGFLEENIRFVRRLIKSKLSFFTGS